MSSIIACLALSIPNNVSHIIILNDQGELVSSFDQKISGYPLHSIADHCSIDNIRLLKGNSRDTSSTNSQSAEEERLFAKGGAKERALVAVSDRGCPDYHRGISWGLFLFPP